jgi:uncharacterized membrane protein YhiD involved in acid resistance
LNSDIQSFFVFSLSPGEALANLVVALLCGIFISILYKVTYRGINYSPTYIVSLIMLCLITALVIMVIGNNLARAFGLVGAMSIIRFRTAVKDTQDIMFIFFALAVGLACGAGMFAISITGTIFIGLVIYVSSIINDTTSLKREYLVQLLFKNTVQADAEIKKVFSKYCSKNKLVNIKKIGEEDAKLTEYSYYIKLKSMRKAVEFTEELNNISNIVKVNVFFDEV